MKRFLAILFISGTLLAPFPSGAQSISELQALIQELQARVAALQAQILCTLPGGLVLTGTLSRGSTGEEVSRLQNFLKVTGFYEYPSITGYFGPVTEAAVKSYQATRGIEQVGVVGPLTRAALSKETVLGCVDGKPENVRRTIQNHRDNPYVDIFSPTVSITSPFASETVSGVAVTVLASASDNTAVVGVTFKLDTNTVIGAEDMAAPYSILWDSTGASDGSHTLVAVARDTSGNLATSSAVTVTVDNTAPIISSISVGTPWPTAATTTWSTDEAADTQIAYGTTAAYGATTTLDTTLATSHTVALTGLSPSTTYHFRIRTADAEGNARYSSDQTFATAATLGISGTPVTAGTVDEAYAGFTVSGEGGATPYTYSLASGTLPDGITLNSSTGAVSGTPTSATTSSDIVIRVTDARGETADLASFTLTIEDNEIAYRYVGIQTVNSGNGYISSAQLSFFEDGNSTDLSLAATMGTTGTANGAGDFGAENLNDGDASSFYASSASSAAVPGSSVSAGNVLYADFGEGNEKTITKIGWRARPSFPQESPDVWRVVGRNSPSDPWSHIAYLPPDHAWVGGQYDEFTITPVGAVEDLDGYRYIKFTYRTTSSGSFWSLMELDIALEASGTTTGMYWFNVTETITPISGWEATKAVNGTNSGNGWGGNNQTLPHSFTVDFGTGLKVDPYEFRLWPRDGSLSQAPSSFKIEGSNDNSTWTPLVDETGVTGWANSTPKTFLSN
ncbi:MAG TPA: Ig-like domain-containing protein [Candidatus Paceibacterota bacterium]|nr:Ig-like domain-containing protein [Candidatus Paceibacterota bacterium]